MEDPDILAPDDAEDMQPDADESRAPDVVPEGFGRDDEDDNDNGS